MTVSTGEHSFQPTDLVLIGPVCAGKSTLGPLLAERLHLPYVSLDDVFWRYYEEEGYRQEAFWQVVREQGFRAAGQLLPPLFVRAVERILKEHPHSIIELGAGHTHYEDASLFQRVRHVLAPYRHVILVLPSPDLDESASILKARCQAERGQDWVHDGYDAIEHWVKDACNHELATLTVYTNGNTPLQTCDEILKHLTAPESQGRVCPHA